MKISNKLTSIVGGAIGAIITDIVSDINIGTVFIDKKLGIFKKISGGGSVTNALMNRALNIYISKYKEIFDLGDKKRPFGESHSIEIFKIINKRNVLIVKNEFNRKSLMKHKGLNIDSVYPDRELYIFGKDYKKIYKTITKIYDKLCEDYDASISKKILVLDYNCFNNDVYSNNYIPMKHLDQIFIRDKDILLKKIEHRYNCIKRIAEHNINASINILIYGPPGTGKSTLALNILNNMTQRFFKDKELKVLNEVSVNKCLLIVNLDIIKDDISKLNSSSDCVILLEDIDTCVNRDKIYDITTGETYSDKLKDAKPAKTGFSDLLRFLDHPPSNVKMIIATTNYLDSLDPALKRDGRFDIKFECEYIDKDISSDMVRYFKQDPEIILKDCEFPICPATVQKLCIDSIIL